MEYKKLMMEIKEGKIAPVYFFFGEEDYLIDRLIETIEEQGSEGLSILSY